MSLRSLVLVTALALAACGSSTGAAEAYSCDLYASPSGSAGAPGSAERPLRSPQQLADRLQAGQTGCLRGGTYANREAGGYVLKFFRGGKAGKRITIRSAPGERAKLNGVVYMPRQSPHVAVRDVDIDGRAPWLNGGDPVTIQIMARDVVLAGNDITNRGLKSCVIVGSNSGWGRAVGGAITDNAFHDCGDRGNQMFDHGIYVENARGMTIARNSFRRIPGYAVHLYPNAQRTKVLGNVMVGNGGGVIFAGEGASASSRNVVEGNVIGGSSGDYNIAASWSGAVGRGNVARRNCLLGGRVGNLERVAGFASRANVEAATGLASIAGACGATAAAAATRALRG